MSGPMVVPDGLAEMPPGPRLARILSTVDPTRLNGWQLVVVLAAQNRQLAHDQARMLATARELVYAPACTPHAPPQRQVAPNMYVASEIAFELTWTEYAGGVLVDAALGCVDRLPVLHEAMLAGRCDLAKVRLIVAELADADDAHARAVVDALVPELDRCTTTQLKAMLRRLLLRLDPAAVRKRRARALAERAVAYFEFSNGTAAVSGSNLPVDKAAAAYHHLDAIARATKAAGDPRTLDQIRADTFTDLLAGVDPVQAGTAKAAAVRRSTIQLHLDLATLAMLSEEPGEIGGFGPVTADIARQTAAQIADRAAWRFTITDHGLTVAEGRLSPGAATVAAGITVLSIGPDGHLRRRPTTAQDQFVKAATAPAAPPAAPAEPNAATSTTSRTTSTATTPPSPTWPPSADATTGPNTSACTHCDAAPTASTGPPPTTTATPSSPTTAHHPAPSNDSPSTSPTATTPPANSAADGAR